PGDQQDVRLKGVAGVDDAKALKVVFGRGAGQHLDVAAVAAAAVVVQPPGRCCQFVCHCVRSPYRTSMRIRPFMPPVSRVTTQQPSSSTFHLTRALTLSHKISRKYTSRQAATATGQLSGSLLRKNSATRHSIRVTS